MADDREVMPLSSAKRDVPAATKRAMRAAHLLGKIIKEHFDNNLCELLVEKSFDWRSYSLNVLDNLLLVGGIPRDILLGTEVKDIDITFNLRELNKIQLNHLRKYHSSKNGQNANCRCAYWQHYLNKFDADKCMPVEEEKDGILKFHNCSYIFNARYFTDIIAESDYLKGKVTIKDVGKFGFISCTISSNIEHENYDLKGQKFEFTDTFDQNKVLSVQKLMQQQSILNNEAIEFKEDAKSQKERKTRWKSIALFPQAHLDFLSEFDDSVHKIDIEIYPIKVRDKLSCYDFSINTAIIPLSSITEFCDSEDEVNIAIWFWEYIVENGLDEIDAMNDIKVQRVLRVPQPYKDLYIIRIHPTTYHFWRTIELMIRLPNFYIDESLITAHMEDFAGWLTVQYLSDEKNRNKFIKKFKEIVCNYCRNVNDVRSMLQTLEKLGFNEKFVKILNNVKELNNDLMAALQSADNREQILVIFSSYGYPFLFGLSQSNFSSPSKQINHKNDNNDVERQKEVLRLKNINQQLESENVLLKSQINELRESKTRLAINSAKAIDELRNYLVKYQK